MDEHERNKWLLSVPEEQASSLSKEDWYDRGRLLKQRISVETIQNNKTFSEKYSKEWGPGHPSWEAMNKNKTKDKYAGR